MYGVLEHKNGDLGVRIERTHKGIEYLMIMSNGEQWSSTILNKKLARMVIDSLKLYLGEKSD